MNTTMDERRSQVQRMRTNFAFEGLRPDSVDVALQNAYIVGALTLDQMLTYARAFALDYV